MRLPLYQVDAFTNQLFRGNPAAICPLGAWLPDAVLQAIAAENNLAETAFFVPNLDGSYHLRWFTPTVEVDLCGHATLAAAFVLWNCLANAPDPITFETRSGRLYVHRRSGGLLELDFPARPPIPCPSNPGLVAALGGLEPASLLAARDYLVVYESERQVADLQPNMGRLAQIDRFAVIVTAPATSTPDCDFVSRFFAPAKGVPEDPVTGSAHTTLVPYWSRRLGKSRLRARQLSARGGDLYCEDRGERVAIAGHAVLYLEGAISV